MARKVVLKAKVNGGFRMHACFSFKCSSLLKKKVVATFRKTKTKMKRVARNVNSFVSNKVEGMRNSLLYQKSKFCIIKSSQKVKRLAKIVSIRAADFVQLHFREKKEEECAICYAPLEEKDKVQKMCHEVFHKECLQTAIDNGFRSCPLCRGNIPPHILTQRFRTDLLMHTATCRVPNCDKDECTNLKRLFVHVKKCGFSPGCVPCSRVAAQLKHHHNECEDLFCKVPMCFFPWNA